MRLQIVRAKVLPIGVDLGHYTVKLAQLRSGVHKLQLLATGSAEIPPPCRSDPTARLNALGTGVRKILKSGPFKGRRAVLSLPAEATFVHNVKLPKMPADRVGPALEIELQGKLPYPVADAVIRHIVAGETYVDGEPREEVIVVSAARGLLNTYLQMARAAKLDVLAVNVEPCAIVDCFSRLFRRATDMARTILMIDLGAVTTQVVLSHGNHITFARNLKTGCEHLDQAIADSMQISVEQAHKLRLDLLYSGSDGPAGAELYHLLDRALDALAGELTQCLRYYESVFRNETIERVIFVGGGAYDTRLCEALAKRLNLPAQIGDPLVRVERMNGAKMWLEMDRRDPQPDWSVAVGLSLGAAEAA